MLPQTESERLDEDQLADKQQVARRSKPCPNLQTCPGRASLAEVLPDLAGRLEERYRKPLGGPTMCVGGED